MSKILKVSDICIDAICNDIMKQNKRNKLRVKALPLVF